MHKPISFSAVFRFSIYAIEPAEACVRYGHTLEAALALALSNGWTLTTLSHQAISAPFGYTASFSIRKSFATAAWSTCPFEAVLGALWIANAHADWLDANPLPSRNQSLDWRVNPAAPRPKGQSTFAGGSPVSQPTRRHPKTGKVLSADLAKIFDDLFS